MSFEGRQVFGLVELTEPGDFVGKIIGFPHIEFEEQALSDVERKLREATTAMIASDSLVRETEFALILSLAGGAKSIVDLTE